MSEQSSRVAVVDDDEAKRYTIVRTLRRAGFEVVEGVSGGDGLRLAPGVALLVLDVKLPDLDGYEVCRKLKGDPATAHVPVLLLSATFVGADSQVEGLESGADAYLTDATEPPVLVATVRALLRMRRAEERAIGLAREWQATFDAITDGVFLADGAGRVVRCNRALGELLGRPGDELVGLPLAVLLPDVPEAAFNRAIAGRRRETAEAEGGGRRLRLTLDPTPGAAGAVGILADVTAARRAEEALRAADQMKDEFLATLAHELRNPLAPIRNGLEILKLTRGDAEAAGRSLAMMERQLGHMLHLIDDLLDVNRISRGKVQLRRARFDLKAAVAAAVETSRPVIEQARHELVLVVPDGPVVVDGDAHRLAQVVSNLLNNAAKYTPAGGRVRLTVGQDAGAATVSVADNGIGIPPAMLRRVFEMFTQVDRTLEKTTGGLGVGLSLVEGLVRLHGGTVEARSEGEGEGSEFVVRLPLAPPPDGGAVEQESRPSGGTPPAPRRILVVDDNVDAADSLSQLLAMFGHEVRTTHDGEAGLEEAAAFRPDLILMDIGMPRLNGYDAARRIREQPWGKDVILVALTGWGQEEDRRKSQEAGFDAHMTKPVETAAMEKLLAGLRSDTA
jgi:PAS domain S-box-containing protein